MTAVGVAVVEVDIDESPGQCCNNLTTTIRVHGQQSSNSTNHTLKKQKKEELINRPRQESNLEEMLVLMNDVASCCGN